MLEILRSLNTLRHQSDHIFNGWNVISKFMVWQENNVFFYPKGLERVTFYQALAGILTLTQWHPASSRGLAEMHLTQTNWAQGPSQAIGDAREGIRS